MQGIEKKYLLEYTASSWVNRTGFSKSNCAHCHPERVYMDNIYNPSPRPPSPRHKKKLVTYACLIARVFDPHFPPFSCLGASVGARLVPPCNATSQKAKANPQYQTTGFQLDAIHTNDHESIQQCAKSGGKTKRKHVEAKHGGRKVPVWAPFGDYPTAFCLLSAPCILHRATILLIL